MNGTPPVHRLVYERRGRSAEDSHRRRQLLGARTSESPHEEVADEDQLDHKRHRDAAIPAPPNAPGFLGPDRSTGEAKRAKDDDQFGPRNCEPIRSSVA